MDDIFLDPELAKPAQRGEISSAMQMVSNRNFVTRDLFGAKPTKGFQGMNLSGLVRATLAEVDPADLLDEPAAPGKPGSEDTSPEAGAADSANLMPSEAKTPSEKQPTATSSPQAETQPTPAPQPKQADTNIGAASLQPSRPTVVFTEAEVTTRIEEAVAAARAEAYAEGRAVAEAEFSEAKEAFNTAAKRLLRPETAQTDELAKSIREAVLALASIRAGMEIDDMPGVFLARIQKIADRATQSTRNAMILMNEADLKAVQPYLKDFPELASDQFIVGKDMLRGDVEVRAEGIQIVDRMKKQPPQKETETPE